MNHAATSTSDPRRITPERVLRWVVYGLLSVGSLLLVWYFVRLVIFLLIGALLAYLMRPVTDWIQSFGLARIPSILATFVLFLGGVGLLLTYLVPFAAAQISAVTVQLSPESIARALSERLSTWLPVSSESVRDSLFGAFDTLFQEDRLTDVAGSVIDLFTNIFYAVLVIPFVAFFFLKDGPRIRSGALALVPNRYFEITLGVIEKVERNMGRYFTALVLQSLSIATISTLALYLIGLDYAFAVGIFTGLANTIPYFGPVIGILAGTAVGISQTGDLSLIPGVLFAMGATQLSDNMLLQPLIFSRAARAHPLVILFVVLVGAQLAGILGMLIAIPLTTSMRVLVQEILWSLRNYRSLRTA